MNDAFYEQFVAKKQKPTDVLIRILIYFFIPAVLIFGTPFLGPFAFLLAVLLAFGAYYLIFPRLSVEYEYSILNHDLDIASIYSKEKRKHQLSIDLQQAEIIAPKGSPRLRSYHPGKVRDFTSGNTDAGVYAIMIPTDDKISCILVEPDARMLDHMKSWTGMKLYQD
ncbi:MAG: hypothetical protein HFH24_02770 [Ruminococcus sp.]|nr:hypothetical protein [Ruminococcus sp.]